MLAEDKPEIKDSLKTERQEDRYVQLEVEAAKRAIGFLVDRGRPGDVAPLYIGIEGGAHTEAVVAALLSELGSADPRTSGASPESLNDREAVLVAPVVNGIIVRLTRISGDDEPLLELDAQYA